MDSLLEIFRNTGKQTAQTTLADVHEWAATRIAALESELAMRATDYSLIACEQEARITALEAQLAAAINKQPEECNECASVAQFKRELAAAQERGRWILVTERLPEDTLQVIACQKPFASFVAFYVPGEGTWYDDNGIELSFLPTHWRELPTPPKESDYETH